MEADPQIRELNVDKAAKVNERAKRNSLWNEITYLPSNHIASTKSINVTRHLSLSVYSSQLNLRRKVSPTEAQSKKSLNFSMRLSSEEHLNYRKPTQADQKNLKNMLVEGIKEAPNGLKNFSRESSIDGSTQQNFVHSCYNQKLLEKPRRISMIFPSGGAMRDSLCKLPRTWTASPVVSLHGVKKRKLIYPYMQPIPLGKTLLSRRTSRFRNTIVKRIQPSNALPKNYLTLTTRLRAYSYLTWPIRCLGKNLRQGSCSCQESVLYDGEQKSYPLFNMSEFPRRLTLCLTLKGATSRGYGLRLWSSGGMFEQNEATRYRFRAVDS